MGRRTAGLSNPLVLSDVALSYKLRSNQVYRTKCFRKDVGKVVLKCTFAISITEVKKQCNF